MNPYKDSFYITDEVSNNAFNLQKRIHKRVYVPALIEGKVADVQIGSKIVFEDLDEDEEVDAEIARNVAGAGANSLVDAIARRMTELSERLGSHQHDLRRPEVDTHG